jgi:hypothetical protein
LIINSSQKRDFDFINDVARIYASFSRKERQNFSQRLMYLYNQFYWAVGLPQPYYVILDHSVLVSIRDAGKESERPLYQAVRTFFHFLQNYTDYDIRVVVSPANLYEWNETKPLKDEAQFTSSLRDINHHVTSLGLRTFLFKCGTYREARKNVKLIVEDVNRISTALAFIKAKKWEINFRKNKVTHFLPHITDRLVPKVRVKYFSRHYVQTVLRSVIDSQVISHSPDKYVRTRLRIEGINWMASLLKLSKGKFEGAGDLEMLEHCATGRQFQDKNGPALIGLTFDKTLFKVLRYYAQYSIESELITIGMDSDEIIKRKLVEYSRRIQDDQRADDRKESFSKRFDDFVVGLERAISYRLNTNQA